MKHIITLLLAIAFAATGASAQKLTRYELKVGDFTELKVADGICVDYKSSADSAGYAVMDCPSAIASAITMTTKGKRLNVQVISDTPITTSLPRITVYSRFLSKAINTGDSTLRVISPAAGAELELTLEGNGRLVARDISASEVKGVIKLGHGNLIITGKCERARLTSVGKGVLEADGLEATEASVKVSGTGTVGVWATEKLSIYGLGSTTIHYKGNPSIKNSSVGISLVPVKE